MEVRVETLVTKQIVGTSIRLWKMNVRTLWTNRPPSKTKEETTNNGIRDRDVGALSTLGIFALTNR
jgi:hypothetical protein